MAEKRAYTPSEFAALFGHEKSWTYRVVKAEKVKIIADLGRMMIPASEADRIEASGTKRMEADDPKLKPVT